MVQPEASQSPRDNRATIADSASGGGFGVRVQQPPGVGVTGGRDAGVDTAGETQIVLGGE